MPKIINATPALPLILAGFGHVGRAFFALLQEKAPSLLGRYGLRLSLRAILRSGGGFFSAEEESLDLLSPELSSIPRHEYSAHPLWKPGLDLAQVVSRLDPGVLVLATTSDLKTGEPGLSLCRHALDSGWHVVMADKAPLVLAFSALQEKARQKRVHLKFSGATAAALPALDLGLYSLAGAEILGLEGILNGTTNFILTEMGKGRSYAESLAIAQGRGIAEPDPSRDVSGWDTAIKLLLLGRAVMDVPITLDDIAVEGITGLSAEFVVRVTNEGKKVKLVGRLERPARASVRPEILNPDHPLFPVDGTNKAIVFTTDTMGIISVSGGKSDPRGAAAALLKDILHVVS